MKQFLTLLLTLFTLAGIHAQNNLVLVEHFTNTFCGICSSRNPAIYNVLNDYQDNVIHLQMNPSVPYSQCPFYNLNPEDNKTRQDYYSIFGTPQLYINGERSSTSSSTFRQNLENAINSFSPSASLSIDHGMLSAAANTVTVDYDISSADGEDIRLFVLLAEKNVSFNAANGESEHPNKFRKFLTSNEGDIINTDSRSNSATFNFDIENDVNLNEAYIIAFIQDVASPNKTVLASTATGLDATVSARKTLEVEWQVFPNPAKVSLQVQWSEMQADEIRLLDLLGKVVLSRKLSPAVQSTVLNLEGIASGQYVIELRNDEGAAVKQVEIQ